MAILSASASEPDVWAATPKLPSVLTACYPAIRRFQRLQDTLLSLCLAIFCELSATVGVALVRSMAALATATKLSVKASTTILRVLTATSLRTSRRLRHSKTAARWNKRVSFEVAMIILNPASNAIFLLVFWPGWWFLAGISWLAWSFSR